MITIKTKKLEKIFGKKVIPFITCMGIDVASRSGWCKATTDPDYVIFDYGFIDIKTTAKYFKYNRFIEIFSNMLYKDLILIIEESYYSLNVKVFQMLSRLGGFIYALAHLNGIDYKCFMLATTARKNLGLKGNAKKAIVHQQFLKKIKFDIKDNDIIDAMILALNGILE